jgi:hypothetical protein
MKKILLAFDGTNFSQGAFEFVRRLNELQPVLVTAAFMPQVDYANLWSYSVGVAGGMVIPLVEDDDTTLVQKNISHFEELCQENNIKFRVHKNFYGFAMAELRKETRFADLLLLGGEMFYNNMGIEMNDYMRETLKMAECPILIVPEHYDFPQSTLLTYDGTESAVYAIKQFAYLFPELTSAPSLLVYSNTGDELMPDKENMEELVSQHFPNIDFFNLKISHSKFFDDWISEKKSAIAVFGAFGRSALSQMFHKSFASDIIQHLKLPVFIAHK